ncbi:hypothetical protein TNCV_4576191 [Trichonephila clavipes]|nr:hypothetical protein TNCV_4576191 [Trichonephila clavipes]
MAHQTDLPVTSLFQQSSFLELHFHSTHSSTVKNMEFCALIQKRGIAYPDIKPPLHFHSTHSSTVKNMEFCALIQKRGIAYPDIKPPVLYPGLFSSDVTGQFPLNEDISRQNP